MQGHKGGLGGLGLQGSCIGIFLSALQPELEKGAAPAEGLGMVRLLRAAAAGLASSTTDGMSQASVAAGDLAECLCNLVCTLAL